MSSRDIILARVRTNQPPATNLPAIPLFDEALPEAWGQFHAVLQRLGGRVLDVASQDTDLDTVIRQAFPDAKLIASVVPEVAGNRPVTAGEDPHALADIDVAVVRARFAVAETGSLCFTEDELVVNTLAYLAQHLVVLLDPVVLLGNLHQAYQREEFACAKYTVFHSGPSATADIEGTLVLGAQGVRSLTVLLCPLAAR